jgi:hypothetical protein
MRWSRGRMRSGRCGGDEEVEEPDKDEELELDMVR